MNLDADRWLLAGAALALGASLLNPGISIKQPLFEHVVILDITQSMNVLDQEIGGQPASRLAAAKAALRRSLLALPCGSKVGWGVFTEYRSFLLLAPAEVCGNLGELESTLDRIDGRMAWSGNSEVAKGLHSAIGIVKRLPGKPSLVFVTDGHEAPPVDPRRRPSFDDKPGDVQGLIVGAGGLLPAPIPKTDPFGRPLGVWAAGDVLQTDPRNRAGAAGNPASTSTGAAPGSEHLSSLREGYLHLLAREVGLSYHRLGDGDGDAGDPGDALARALKAQNLARPVQANADLRPVFAALSLILLLARPALRWRRAPGQKQGVSLV
jgi:mxaL protein